MFDIITFGSASRDIFLRSKNFSVSDEAKTSSSTSSVVTVSVVDQKKFVTGKGLCLSLGSKIDVEDVCFLTGGGGTNTATTFANQGFKTAFCGMVGDELAGEEIFSELKKLKVDTRLIQKTKKKMTNYSVVLSSGQKERTILVYRGASGELSDKDIPWSRLDAKWLYLAPLSGKLVRLSDKIVDFAKRKGIKVAMNPGNSQLSLPKSNLEKIFKKVDVLFLNQEEASILTKIPYQEEIEIFKKIDKLGSGICVMTKGSQGVVVSDGKYLYRAGTIDIKAIDWTGAGDSFASGFLSGFIYSKGDIEYSIQLGIANSAACLKQLGAKNGLLKKGDKLEKVKVTKELCSKNNNCKVK